MTRHNMIYGYARISANDSDFKIQHKALTAALCDDIFIDTAPSDENLNKMISATVSGDSVIVWRLDKLATSATQLSVRVRHLNDKGVSFITLREGVTVRGDSEASNPLLNLFDALANFEKTKSQLRGHCPTGRKPVVTHNMLAQAKTLIYGPTRLSVEAAAKKIGVSRATLYRALKR